jgi:glucokinase
MSLAQKEVLGVDIGGSNIKAGRVLGDSLLSTAFTEVQHSDSEETILKKLYKTIDEIMTDTTEAIGIGVPAVVDLEKGVVYDVQNLPAWKNVALKELLEKKYKIPVHINNDANCFALGQKYFGDAKNYVSYVALSLGTGLGMGVIIDNKLYNGVLCGAGEIGMLQYKDGIMEQYTGSFFFVEKYGETAKALFEKALKNDAVALGAFKEYGLHLGQAIKAILYLYAPEAIILGGSISKAYPYFKDSVKEVLDTFAYSKQLNNLVIETSELTDAPILGAAALCL